ncbi:MAG TPA: hypothetical protein DCG53_00830 [Syntrophus sp. (in: bacteria)]|nr:hypothetical protein [Syntrophus sp. (in: bacteria)]
MKKIWISALEKDQEKVQKIMSTVKTYGLAVDGHFWLDDLTKMAWDSALEPLAAKDTALWIIIGAEASWQTLSIRQGLSLLALAVQHQKGLGFPILIVPTEGTIDPEMLPTLFRGAEVIPFTTATLGPKIVALANRPVTPLDPGYRLNLHALHGIGLWFEVGPPKDIPWDGAMFGVHGADIDVHGVGPADGIPARTVLEYAMKGMKVNLGEEEFNAWAAQNHLDGAMSYYVRVQGVPDKLLFGPYAANDDAEVHIVALT